MWNIRRSVYKLIILITAGVTVLSLGACVGVQPGFTPAGQATNRLNVCTSSASPTQMNVQYALAEGLFAKYDLDVTVSEISGGSTAVTALIAGDVDLCQIAGAAVVSAAIAGAEVVFVGGVINQQPYYLITRPDVRTPADLVGQALAVSGPGSSSYAAAVAVLDEFGLTPDRDVAILSIGGQSERMAALESGNIAGAILSPPQAMQVVADGYHLLFDFAELEEPYQHTAVVTTRAFLEEHPDLVARYIQATSEAVAAMHADREKAIAAIATYLQLDPVEQADVLALTYDLIVLRHMRVEPTPSLSGIQALLNELQQKDNPEAANYQPEDFVDTQILAELAQSGFFADLDAADE